MKLKPCPNVLCGCAEIEQLELVQEHSNNEDVFYYQCTVCGCVPIGESSSRKKAIEAWNNRPLEDSIKSHAIEVLAKALQNRYISMISLGCKTEKDLSMETMRAEARALLGWEE